MLKGLEALRKKLKIAFLFKTIEIKPNYIKAYNNLGTILRSEGKLNKSIFYLKKAIQIKPDFPNANLNIGIVLKEIGNFKEAENLHLKQLV